MGRRAMLYSHPDKLLADHLKDVVWLSHCFLKEKEVSLLPAADAFLISTINGIAHDLGKATRFFQEYLSAPEALKEILRSKPHTHHGLFSAICGYYLAKEVFVGHENGDLYALVSFLVIRRHHGNLQDIMDETIISPDEAKILVEQCQAIDEKEFNLLCQELTTGDFSFSLTYEQVARWVEEILEEKLRLKARQVRRQRGLAPYFLVNFFYSLLVDADKTEAAVGRETFASLPRITVSGDIVEKFKKEMKFRQSPLNQLREEAYREVTVRDYALLQPGVYTINLPTGLGKTLASFSFACRLKQALWEKKAVNYRLIYALPFLSIIDQNYHVIEEILTVENLAKNSNVLLKHHHLATKAYGTKETEFEPDEAKIMVEGWNAEIIVTTFVQLFETLITGKNSMVRKFHRLANAILLLDEVQTVCHELWPLIKEVLTFLTTHLKSYVIFVTATDPLIFPREELIPLVQREKYFLALNRLQVQVNLEKETVEGFLESLSLQPGRSYLFIFNTIGCAEKFYYLFTQKVGEKVIFLSSHITPKQRLERIKMLKEGKARFAVTTQLVEAGVDIDFNVVYRDIAPLDAINQAAGRCNRNGEEVGSFRVIALVDDKNKLYASYIYDPEQLAITWDLLQNTQTYWEKDFLLLIDRYYEEVKQRCSFDRAHEYLEALYNLRYQQTEDTGEKEAGDINSFRLIQSYPKVDVFVTLDEQAEALWKEYLSTREIRPLPQRRSAFERIKADFYQYVITVPTTVKNIPPQEHGFFYIPKLQLEEYYDYNTGYKVKGTNAIW